MYLKGESDNALRQLSTSVPIICNTFSAPSLCINLLLVAVSQKWSKLVAGANHTMYICATFQVAERQRRDAIS